MISTTTKKLKRYCSEPIESIENYELAVNDKEHMWHCHHRLEVQGQFRNSKELLERCGMYWHRPASELIFLRKDEHRRIHMTGRIVSETTLKRMSAYRKGRRASESTRKKMSASMTNHKAFSKPTRMTRISDGFTKVFPSSCEAVRWLRENGYPKASQGCLGNCLRGNTKYSYGAHWSYT